MQGRDINVQEGALPLYTCAYVLEREWLRFTHVTFHIEHY